MLLFIVTIICKIYYNFFKQIDKIFTRLFCFPFIRFQKRVKYNYEITIHALGGPCMHSHETNAVYFHMLCPYDTPVFCTFHPGALPSRCNVDFYEINIITGSYRHIYENTSSLVHTGTLLFYKPGQPHALLQDSKTSHHYSLIVK